MNFTEQLSRRRDQLTRTNAALATLTGYAASHLSAIFRGKKDCQGSTLEALADALDAQWVLVPRHLMPEVERLLSGKAIGPDDVPSGLERVLLLRDPTPVAPTSLNRVLQNDSATTSIRQNADPDKKHGK